MSLPLLLCVLCGLTPTIVVTGDRTQEISVGAPTTLLEAELHGEIRRLYADAIEEIRRYKLRDAANKLREARARTYHQMTHGGSLVPSGVAIRRVFVRISYVESEVLQLQLVDELLKYRSQRSDQTTNLQLRALLVHNVFLAVLGFTGQLDRTLADRVIAAYREARLDGGRLSREVKIGYASMLAEQGNRAEARKEAAGIAPADWAASSMDLLVIYYHLAVGEKTRAVDRLLETSLRDNWQRSEGTSLRSSLYRMNDFDRLRSHPRYQEMVARPEEEMAGFQGL